MCSVSPCTASCAGRPPPAPPYRSTFTATLSTSPFLATNAILSLCFNTPKSTPIIASIPPNSLKLCADGLPYHRIRHQRR